MAGLLILGACGASAVFGALAATAPLPTLAGIGIVCGIQLAHDYIPPVVEAAVIVGIRVGSGVRRALSTTTPPKAIPNDGKDDEYEFIS